MKEISAQDRDRTRDHTILWLTRYFTSYSLRSNIFLRDLLDLLKIELTKICVRNKKLKIKRKKNNSVTNDRDFESESSNSWRNANWAFVITITFHDDDDRSVIVPLKFSINTTNTVRQRSPNLSPRLCLPPKKCNWEDEVKLNGHNIYTNYSHCKTSMREWEAQYGREKAIFYIEEHYVRAIARYLLHWNR